MNSKFKIGDILIQCQKGTIHSDIIKIIKVLNNRYMIEILSSTNEANVGDVFMTSRLIIENEGSTWIGARYLTDEEKVELL